MSRQQCKFRKAVVSKHNHTTYVRTSVAIATRRGSVLLNASTHLTHYRRVWARARELVMHAHRRLLSKYLKYAPLLLADSAADAAARQKNLRFSVRIFDHGSVAYLSISVKTTLRNHHHVVRWCVAYIPGRCNLVWADRTRRHDVFHSLCILWTIVLHGAMIPILRLYPKNILCELLI